MIQTSFSLYYSVLVDNKLIIFNNHSHEIAFEINDVFSYQWSYHSDDKLIILSGNNTLYEVSILKKNCIRLSTPPCCIFATQIGDDQLFKVSLEEREEDLRVYKSLPLYKKNIYINLYLNKDSIISHSYENVTSYKFLGYQKDSKKLYFLIETFVGRLHNNTLLSFELDTLTLNEQLLPFDIQGLSECDYGLVFYAKKPNFGAYSIQNLWLMTKLKRLINLSVEDKYYGNCIISDVDSTLNNTCVVDNNNIYFIISYHGRTYVECLNLSNHIRAKVYESDSSIYQLFVNRNVLYVLDSTIQTKHRMTLIDVESKQVLFQQTLSYCNSNIMQTQEEYSEVDYFLLSDKSKKTERGFILWIPGGPMVQHGYGQVNFLNSLVENGYGILIINHFGRQGYGQEFCKAIRGKWGYLEVDAIFNIVDHLFQKGTIDYPLNLIGHSYGGYITYLLLSEDNEGRFCRGISLSAISSKYTTFGQSDIGYLEYLDSKTYPWEDERYYLKNSPLENSLTIKNPMLLMHGENDKRVPVQESYQMFTWLRMLEKDCTLVTFDSNDHKWIYHTDHKYDHEKFKIILNFLRSEENV